MGQERFAGSGNGIENDVRLPRTRDRRTPHEGRKEEACVPVGEHLAGHGRFIGDDAVDAQRHHARHRHGIVDGPDKYLLACFMSTPNKTTRCHAHCDGQEVGIQLQGDGEIPKPLLEDLLACDPLPVRVALASDDLKRAATVARAWTRWEGSMNTLFPDAEQLDNMLADATALSIARIESYYTANILAQQLSVWFGNHLHLRNIGRAFTCIDWNHGDITKRNVNMMGQQQRRSVQ